MRERYPSICGIRHRVLLHSIFTHFIVPQSLPGNDDSLPLSTISQFLLSSSVPSKLTAISRNPNRLSKDKLGETINDKW